MRRSTEGVYGEGTAAPHLHVPLCCLAPITSFMSGPSSGRTWSLGARRGRTSVTSARQFMMCGER
ncbi:hypothetical protein E2C01_094363 [Portunus trituberculatus]|uniref:Uncharacterized protein n=1 Tax=Portunus trituberculatus TaxID=210409 RepID=A0A5B7JLP6_PORTR|nr:hypothetical protein [Portunus trituberculatus]